MGSMLLQFKFSQKNIFIRFSCITFLCCHQSLKSMARLQLNLMKAVFKKQNCFFLWSRSTHLRQYTINQIFVTKTINCFCSEKTGRHTVLLRIIPWCLRYSQFTSCVIFFLLKTEALKYWPGIFTVNLHYCKFRVAVVEDQRISSMILLCLSEPAVLCFKLVFE